MQLGYSERWYTRSYRFDFRTRNKSSILQVM